MADEREPSGQEGSQGETERPEARGSSSGRPPHIVWALVSAVVLVVFAPGLFAAGFFTNELVSDDDSGTDVVAQPSPSAGTPSAPPPTPAPVVAASADDDPFIGPEDASVTIIEFTDYQ
jgi:protein-disulfide isomerase